MELLWTDGTGEEYAPLITADVTGTVLGVLPHTVVTVPVSFRDGGQLRLIGGGGGGTGNSHLYAKHSIMSTSQDYEGRGVGGIN